MRIFCQTSADFHRELLYPWKAGGKEERKKEENNGIANKPFKRETSKNTAYHNTMAWNASF